MAEDPLTAQIAVRLTQREYQLIAERAAKESRTISAVARMLVRSALGLDGVSSLPEAHQADITAKIDKAIEMVLEQRAQLAELERLVTQKMKKPG